MMTDFGKVIKIALVNRGEKQAWLVDQVKEKTGLYFDASYLTKIINGKINAAPQIIAAIKEILNI